MAKKNETISTIFVAAALCFVCSILVSLTVVNLRERQVKNAEIDFKKNILMSAGLYEEEMDIEAAFSKIKPVIVNFDTGEIVNDVDEKEYNQTKAASDPSQNVSIPSEKDIGGISTRAKLAKVYLVEDDVGKISQMIFNVRGKGLWSTMYGFISVDSDTTTIKGFAYYSHGETPGLGGEVDNPKWKQQWVGKKIYDENWNVAFEVNKGPVDASSSLASYKVDGLSGATITANGVSNSMKYWFGSHGYGKFLSKVRSGEI